MGREDQCLTWPSPSFAAQTMTSTVAMDDAQYTIPHCHLLQVPLAPIVLCAHAVGMDMSSVSCSVVHFSFRSFVFNCPYSVCNPTSTLFSGASQRCYRHPLDCVNLRSPTCHHFAIPRMNPCHSRWHDLHVAAFTPLISAVHVTNNRISRLLTDCFCTTSV